MTRRPRTAAVLSTLALAAAMSVAAAAPEGCYVALDNDPTTEADDVIACEEQQWFHRATTHASNLGYVAAPHGIATFDTTAPAGSVSGGNGGGYLAWSTLLVGGDDGLTDAQFVGSHTGVLDRLDVDLHMLVDSFSTLDGLPVVSAPDQPLDIDLYISGAKVFSEAEVRLQPVVEEASQAGSLRLDFAITGLAALLDQYGLENGPETTHDVRLVAGAAFLDQVTVFAFDTTEVPGGIGFNRVELPAGTLELPAS